MRLTLGVVRDVIGASNLPDGLKLELKGWNFALLNRYQRKYFLSENKAYRLTIDMMLEFFRLHPLHNRFLNASKDTLSTIIELKYPIDKDEGADSISKHLPFRVAKNSKFVSGFERINNFFNPNN